MKTKIALLMIAFLLPFMGCKKDLQPEWQWLVKCHYILEDLDKYYSQTILPKIEKARTSMKEVEWNGEIITTFVWGTDTVKVPGPASYERIAECATSDYIAKYQEEMLPIITELTNDGDIPEVVELYLDERRDHTSGKAYKKLRLAIAKDQYELMPFFYEFVLQTIKDYLTGDIGGDDDWSQGIRSLEAEVRIRNLTSEPIPDDPWGCDCNAEIYIKEIFKEIADGPDDKAATPYIHNSQIVTYDDETQTYFVEIEF
jgi:hypothetical protein